jgi:integrase
MAACGAVGRGFKSLWSHMKIHAYYRPMDYKCAMETIEVLTPYENFVFALKSKDSKRQYPNRLDRFLTFMGLQGTIEEKCVKLYELSKNDINLLQSYLIRFINSQKERIENKEIAEGTLRNYIKAIKLFLSMNDIIVNWKKLSKGIPAVWNSTPDRIPTMDEIKKLLEHPDRRIKPIVFTMMSAGFRVGSWDHLKWKHVIPIVKNDIIIAAKIILKNTKINNKDYFSFITPEAYHTLKDWMDFRKLHGESITGESWLMRDTWQKTDKNHGHRIGLAKYPKKFGSIVIRNMIYEAWKVQGVRQKLSDPQVKRHEFTSTHSFRKIFETRCQKAKMNHNHIKILMDHSFGESQNYHLPTEQELLDDYLNAVDLLTINDEFRLKKKIEVLEVQKSRFETIIKDVEQLKKKYNRLKA